MRKIILVTVLIGLTSAFSVGLKAQQDPPAWWASQSVLQGTAEDYAACNLGQLKYLTIKAKMAVMAVGGELPTGEGSLGEMVETWEMQTAPLPEDYQTIQIGQLKWVASQLYSIPEIYPPQIPIYGGEFLIVADPADDQVATLGQAKYIFSFILDSDLDGLADYWEQQIIDEGLGVDRDNNGVIEFDEIKEYEDSDWDGLDNQTELAAGTDPYFNELLPDPWFNVDIGDTLDDLLLGYSKGSATYDDTSDEFTLTSSGRGFLGTDQDSLHYMGQLNFGDQSIIVRLAETTSLLPIGAKAGIMLRQDLNPDSRHVSFMLAQDGTLELIHRKNKVGEVIRLEAEDTPYLLAALEARKNASGGLYLNVRPNNPVIWTLGPHGDVDLLFGYASSRNNRKFKIELNGNVIDSALNFPNTEVDGVLNWTTTTSLDNQTLDLSSNTISATKNGSTSVQPFLDYLELTTLMSSAGTNTQASPNSIYQFPLWLKIDKIGHEFTAYYSDVAGTPNESDWIEFASIPLALDWEYGFYYAGVGLVSGDASQTASIKVTDITAGLLDADGDGIEDWWEYQIIDAVALDTDVSNDNITSIQDVLDTDDPDGDGASHLTEFQNGSNPVLQSPWESLDIGDVALPGVAVGNPAPISDPGPPATYLDQDTFVLQASGTGFNRGETSDEFHYLYQPIRGDGYIKIRIPSPAEVTQQGFQNATERKARIGVMIRDSLTESSKMAAMVISRDKDIPSDFDIRYIHRSEASVTDETDDLRGTDQLNLFGGGNSAPDQTLPVWLKLERKDNVFTGSFSKDNITWYELESEPTNLLISDQAYIGIALASNENAQLLTAVVDNVEVVTYDQDLDGVSDDVESQAGTDPTQSNSDGDLLGDYEEIFGTFTDPKVDDIVSVETFKAIKGNAVSSYKGNWRSYRNGFYNLTQAGSVTYDLEIGSGEAGIYRLDILLENMSVDPLRNRFELLVYVDGMYAGIASAFIDPSQSKVAWIYLPYLNVGSHSITLEMHHYFSFQKMRIESLTLQKINGVADWYQQRLQMLNSVDTVTSSPVSPVCLEGNAFLYQLVSINGSLNAQLAPDDRWFSNIALNASGPTAVNVSFENGGLTLSPFDVTWEATDVYTASDMTIRKDDALLFEANLSNSAEVVITKDSVQVASYTINGGQRQQHLFNEAGIYTIESNQNGGSGYNMFDVTVVTANLGEDFYAWIGKERIWAPDTFDIALDAENHMQADGRVDFVSTTSLLIGSHIGEENFGTEDSLERTVEKLGYIILEPGTGTISGVHYSAALGSNVVKGLGNIIDGDTDAPYIYDLSGFSNPDVAVASIAGMNGGDGAWPLLYGSNPLDTGSGTLSLAVDEDLIYDDGVGFVDPEEQIADTDNRIHPPEQLAYAVFDHTTPDGTGPKLQKGVLNNVGSSWVNVSLTESYSEMVVVATPNYDETQLPIVTRIRNANGSSFELKVQNPSGTTITGGYRVHYIVMEAGVYPGVQAGLIDRDTPTVAGKKDWDQGLLEIPLGRTYSNPPVMLGQVMTHNDPQWSVFWSRGAYRSDPPLLSAYEVTTYEPKGRAIVARTEPGGPVIDAVNVQGIALASSVNSTTQVVETLEDGTEVIEMSLILTQAIEGLTVELVIFQNGVMFFDDNLPTDENGNLIFMEDSDGDNELDARLGSQTLTLTMDDFDENGVAVATFLMNTPDDPDNPQTDENTTICHRLFIYQDGELVGQR
ncbi:MAG: hypothetical protein AAGA18_12895 [Verrucomicrobiota bacterium]